MIIITGTPGSGKSTLLKPFSKEFIIINYGTIMFEIALKKGFVKNRDQLRKLEYEKQIKIQKEAAKKIASMKNKDKIILDTHAVVSTPKGYYPGLNKEALEILNPETLVFVYVPYSELKQRIKQDKSRTREEFLDKKKCDEVVEISKLFLAVYAVRCNAKIVWLDNSGPVGSAVPRMKEILE
ncbi:MAG: adenylate kinase [Candidatus Micrarchaeia archaeon]|jgi:adenylate kinase